MAHSLSAPMAVPAGVPRAPSKVGSRPRTWPGVLLGVFLTPVAGLMLATAARIGASPSGWSYAGGLVLVAIGLMLRARGLWRVGLGLIALVAGSRLLFADGTLLETVHLPDGGHRWVNRLVDERDGTLFAAHALVRLGKLPRTDASGFIPALEAAFDRMESAEGSVATPAIATYLGLQSAESFDALVIPPARGVMPETAVVFLHGYAGNFAVYCWEMARASWSISALTVCPSVGPAGDWWSPQGAATLKATLEWLSARGVRHFYLGGLSNGGVGASMLVNRVSHPGLELRGLVLVSGAKSSAPVPEVPTLVIQGRHDSMMDTPSMRSYVERLGGRATYVELDSGHFAFLDRHLESGMAISQWLRQREGK
ncbi:alpha/beta hydrolase [Myxococcus sp. K38C18041901]|uniref:alpha/beta hydrolase n=1 Tax=Myxococcus guangdongensis TaxID=2906760 RepID=UPI0020A71670|nr:alpha/beta hydrolase [Myxococcus guangdongensis]MCP3063643.1 alpha/beta hydrolase [Myxococcus guangdongensis]